ncbi:RNA polymerase sigma factor [Sphingomonas colocasiae]|uniref:Sigma-70 family RNA polymerase sigma factor n=1 Tax=Sphingomonas colocasiae TaxID=1848973 RepID=A0ABS7PVX9_9SPHN|nr:sigma-70 family RNA polymerase sigma factor [Sphingomonas colocasiae]MBY8825301.1 sigma-70 family RNA polymerase sigma factor [Sphingomonas colocasiae]
MRSLEEIIDSYGAGIARLAASYEADPMLQEDLTQDILLAIHRALPSLRAIDRLGPFVFRIAHNRGVEHVMKEMRIKRQRAVEIDPEPDTGGPERHVMAGDSSQRVHRAIRRLPLPYRQVITLLLEDLSYAEIGETLGISASNVGVRVNRAKAQLKAMLDG